MARVDLNQSIIRLVDGFNATAAVNDTPASGNTDLDIDTVVEGVGGTIIPKTARFTIAGADQTYLVTDSAGDSVQVVTMVGTLSSGHWTLTFNGVFGDTLNQTTANIIYNATASQVQSALEALAGIDVGDVTVTGSASGPFTVTFKGAYKDTKMANLTANDVDLMGSGHDDPTISVTHQGGTTYNISFTPALASLDGLPADDAVITVTGRTLEIKLGDGDLTYTEKRPRKYILDRGNLDEVKDDDQAPVEVSCDSVWEELRSVDGEQITFEEAFKQVGAAADWVSSDTDQCKPYSVDIEIEAHKTCGSFLEIITLPSFRYEQVDHSLKDATLKFQGKCNVVDAIVNRVS